MCEAGLGEFVALHGGWLVWGLELQPELPMTFSEEAEMAGGTLTLAAVPASFLPSPSPSSPSDCHCSCLAVVVVVVVVVAVVVVVVVVVVVAVVAVAVAVVVCRC